MAEFSKLTITNKGQALIAKIISGTAETQFTKVCTSSFQYENELLGSLTEISDIKQTSLISSVKRTSDSQITVEVGFTNIELTSGYYIRTLGLYALDPDEGEILYGVTIETSGNCYMPAYNGVTVGGAIMRISTAVGNAENVSLEVNPGVFVTVEEFKGHTHSAADINSGTFGVSQGGTGLTSVGAGNFLMGNGEKALQEVTPEQAIMFLGAASVTDTWETVKYGSYTGNGQSGEDNSIFLQFEFGRTIRFLFVQPTFGGQFFIATYGCNTGTLFFFDGMGMMVNTVWESGGVRWYANTANAMSNDSGTEFRYIAICG